MKVNRFARRTQRGLVLLVAVPLLGAVPLQGAVPVAAEAHVDENVVLRTAAPRTDVHPGRAYAWTFTVSAKGPAKSGKAAFPATFRATLPKTLEFVSGKKNCRAKGRKVTCRLGTLKKGREVKGVLRAKVSSRARSGQKIVLRGTVTWGEARATRRFPAVRVTRAGDVAEAEPATSRAAVR
ncbi:MAG TPA: hypothetical protein VIL71_22345 [Spirillospora sp.]